jgi:hypothetical protein
MAHSMHRTTLMLPRELKARALKEAKAHGVSLGEWIRQVVATALRRRSGSKDARDPLYDDAAVFRKPGPKDLAEQHDRYLYGEDG